MKKGWSTIKLRDLYQIGSSKRVLKSQWKTEGVPFYRGREVTRLASDGFVNNELFISEKHFAELSKEYGVPKAGDIVITAIGTIGNSHIVRDRDRFYFKDASVLWMKRTAEVSSEFVNLWLKSPTFFDQLDRGNGATVDTLTIQKLQSVDLTIPPLAEQQRIVGLLDEAFAGIATAKANAEKNLQNARALFESHLQSVFTQRGPGWVEKSLSDIAQVKGGKRVPKGYKLLNEPTGYPYLRVADFTDTGTIEISDLRYVSAEVHREIKNYVIYSTDLYMSIAGTIGKTGIIPRDLDGANLTENACRLVFNPGVSNRFVYYFTVTPDFVEQAGLNTRTAAQPKLALSRLSTIKLGIPPLQEQKRLAAEFDVLSEETQHLTHLYERKLAALEALKKSLLHQAFTGAL